MLQALADKDYERLSALQAPVGAGTRLRAKLYQCGHSTHDAYLTLTSITRKTVGLAEEEGEPAETDLARFAMVSGSGAAILKRGSPPRTPGLANTPSASVEVEEDREELPARRSMRKHSPSQMTRRWDLPNPKPQIARWKSTSPWTRRRRCVSSV